LVLRTLIATPVSWAPFAAYSGSLELSAFIQEPQIGCDEKASLPAADEQQAVHNQNIPCEPQGPTAEQDDRAYLLETASPGSTMGQRSLSNRILWTVGTGGSHPGKGSAG
jgi:hypothetical protein